MEGLIHWIRLRLYRRAFRKYMKIESERAKVLHELLKLYGIIK